MNLTNILLPLDQNLAENISTTDVDPLKYVTVGTADFNIKSITKQM
jgi:hypothetical protein